ncbi:MAG: hypothetical protein ACTSQ8_07955 [Candidatus Helarchaeota archaeon]
MRIGKVQGFLQGFLRACKRDFNLKYSDMGSWDEFIAYLCSIYADQSDNKELDRMADIIRNINVAFFKIPIKYLKDDEK